MVDVMNFKSKEFAPCKGSHTLGKVIPGLGINLHGIVWDNEPIPSDNVELVFNDMENLEDVGEACRDKFDLLSKAGIASRALQSGMGSSQPMVVDA